ncbi:MAG: EAL domain-containing protein [Desulfobulbaceae bacterium]|nr:EAL domain-containing protein [Desulfobulbaceae bacterium]
MVATATNGPLALVVDDDNSSRLTMAAALRKAGFTIKQATNGEDAITLFEEKQPDLIFLDVLMPGMDGFATCREIRRRSGGEYVQILMVTGLDDTESIKKAFLAGGNDFVSKPINWEIFGHRAQYMLRSGKALKEVHLSRSFLAKTQEVAKIGNWKVNLKTNLCTISSEAASLLSLQQKDLEEITVETLLNTIIGNEKQAIYSTVESAIRKRNSFMVNFQIQLEDDSVRHIYMQGEVLPTEGGEPELLFGVVQDSTQMKQAEEEIRYLAFYDSLTGLANRTLFLDRLSQVLEHCKRKRRSFALLFMDIDHFKQINDTMGHHAGDILLKNTADTIQQCVRRSDSLAVPGSDAPENLVARHGGDEFVLILSEIDSPESSAVVARRILKAVQQKQIINSQEISITASIGISVFPEDGTDADTLYRHADTAMYHAKKLGRNNYQFFKESLNSSAVARFTLERDMKAALLNNDFILYFQPQLRISDQKIIGAEALIRWIHPEKGFIAPDQFIAIAEDCGLIVEINKWVIEAACLQSRKWREQGIPDMRIAINLSGYRLAEQNIIGILKENLELNSLDGTAIEVEVTENVLMRDTESITKTFGEIKGLGIRVALDDFGTGYSSLSYLTSFHVDTLKIDRSFIMGCTDNKKNRVIIKAIIAMGHSLGMKIVAEGIESNDHLQLLKEYDCDECQGFYFSPPVPALEFQKLIGDSKP